MFVLVKHLVFAFGYRTADDERCTGIVYQHGVHLVHNGIVMSALNQIHRRDSHIVAQVVKAELVVRTERDVCRIGFPAVVRVGFVLVDTIHCHTMEHIERTHPLRVTFGEVIVHRHHVYAFMRHGVEEDGQGRYQGLTFTGGHLCYLALVEHNAANELHIVVHHIPCHFVAAGGPMVEIYCLIAVYLHEVKARVGSQVAVHIIGGNAHFAVLCKAAGCGFHNGKHFGKNLHQHLFVGILDGFAEFVYLVIHFFAFVDIQFLYACFQGGNTGTRVAHTILYLLHERSGTGTQGIVVQCVYFGIDGLDLFHNRHYLTHIALRFIAKQFAYKTDKTHIFCSF